MLSCYVEEKNKSDLSLAGALLVLVVVVYSSAHRNPQLTVDNRTTGDR
jgi:hypothetical protein